MGRAATPRIAIIGAGMSGLCMAGKLLDDGIDTFTVYEKADDVGGTWRDNTYPGLICDVPSRYYTYSFHPNAEWSRLNPPGAEIQTYLRRVADERGLRRYIRFGVDVTSAVWAAGRWRVTTAEGTESFDVLITATGVLRVPRYPDIAGLDDFAGHVFHSSRWDHSVSLPDKRIGVIGTGSTGVQITGALGGDVRGLTVFQRTAQWVCPWPNPRYSRAARSLMRRWPALMTPGYRFWGWFVRFGFGRGPVQPGVQRTLFTAACRWNLRLSVRDPELRRKLTPKDLPMCKRMIFAGHYFQSVQKPGVEVVTDEIDRVEQAGVRTVDGRLHELDVLVLATGFDARAYTSPMVIEGRNGLRLDKAWTDGAVAYRSVAVPGFPNMFMLMGPHSPIGNQSLVPIAESQADYALWWIHRIGAGEVAETEPTEAATKEYNEDMKAAMPQTIWMSGCSSWYLGRDGLPELFPWPPEKHAELLAVPDPGDFEVRPHRV